MDPRVVAAQSDDVVVLWHQRGRSAAGDSIDEEVLGLYHFRDAKLARAQMFCGSGLLTSSIRRLATLLEKPRHFEVIEILLAQSDELGFVQKFREVFALGRRAPGSELSARDWLLPRVLMKLPPCAVPR